MIAIAAFWCLIYYSKGGKYRRVTAIWIDKNSDFEVGTMKGDGYGKIVIINDY